jgi:hypothetical protein
MSTVNKYNYEAVLLDFAEGRLSSKETNDLFQFLAAHPELQEDFDAALEMISLDEDADFSFSKKSELLQDESYDSQQNLIIAHVEGVSSQEETEQLEALRNSDATVEKEIVVFSKLKMEADAQIIFSRKDELLQEKTVRFSAWLYRTTYAAAAIFLLFLLFTAVNKSQKIDFTEMAKAKVKQLNQSKEVLPFQVVEEPWVAEDVKFDDTVNPSRKALVKPNEFFDKENNVASNVAIETEPNEAFEYLPIRRANSLEVSSEGQLATISEIEPDKLEEKEKFNSGLLDYLANESPLIQNSYGFAGDLSDKIKSFSGEFQKVDEIELKIWGMRTTIRKPSWMKWRRQKVKSE